MPILDHRFKDVMHHFHGGARLHVFLILFLRGNVRNRCWPSMRRIAKDTGYALAAVNEAKKWLEEHGAIEVVKYDQRIGEEKKGINHLQNVYQLTGVIKFNGVTYPYLYVPQNETSDNETSRIETEVVKEFKSVKKRKETTFAPASQGARVGVPSIADEADDPSMFSIPGKKALAGQSKNATQDAHTPLKGKDSKAEDTTALSPIPDAPLSQAAPKKRSEKQLANDARIEALRVALAVGRGKEDIPLQGKEISNYSKIANELVEGGVPCEDFLAYVQYWNTVAQTWPGGLTLNSLVKPGRITDFKSFRAKNPTEKSTTLPAYRSYSPQNDVAYSADSDGSQ